LDLQNFDGVLAFGKALKEIYLRNNWAERVFVWHEAADVRIFHPCTSPSVSGDVVWIGNWGDEERSAELRRYLIGPVKELALEAAAYGVRYPEHGIAELRNAGVTFKGWLPNYEVPQVFGGFKATVHVPRRPYCNGLPGIPTIRVFEALACGIPLLCAPWEDSEELFRKGDYLEVTSGSDMADKLRDVLEDSAMAQQMSVNGLKTVLQRHTCAHRVSELLSIYSQLRQQPTQ
jgi:spore maturation protein CgeB